MDVNANIAECIKSVGHFGGETYMNICNGAETHVPWGATDWILSISLIIIVVIVAAFAVVGLIALIKQGLDNL